VFVAGVLVTVVVIDLLMFKLLTNNPWMRSKFWRYISLGLVTAVPPQSSTCMNVAAATSQRRLKKKSLISNNLWKIVENGLINLICLDKTGTLTGKTCSSRLRSLPQATTIRQGRDAGTS